MSLGGTGVAHSYGASYFGKRESLIKQQRAIPSQLVSVPEKDPEPVSLTAIPVALLLIPSAFWAPFAPSDHTGHNGMQNIAQAAGWHEQHP